MGFQQAATDIFLGTNDSLFRTKTIKLFSCFHSLLFSTLKNEAKSSLMSIGMLTLPFIELMPFLGNP